VLKCADNDENVKAIIALYRAVGGLQCVVSVLWPPHSQHNTLTTQCVAMCCKCNTLCCECVVVFATHCVVSVLCCECCNTLCFECVVM